MVHVGKNYIDVGNLKKQHTPKQVCAVSIEFFLLSPISHEIE